MMWYTHAIDIIYRLYIHTYIIKQFSFWVGWNPAVLHAGRKCLSWFPSCMIKTSCRYEFPTIFASVWQYISVRDRWETEYTSSVTARIEESQISTYLNKPQLSNCTNHLKNLQVLSTNNRPLVFRTCSSPSRSFQTKRTLPSEPWAWVRPTPHDTGDSTRVKDSLWF